ncbi:MAG TPA: RagB/SusD family nutrient uptake outer membrane protein [Ferruginibacter sp.]|nr:RagB/SusD family nutrient uptake outer membrane protein [Ferruginibacter sp.]
MQLRYILSIAVLIAATTTSCKKDFFNRPPENAATVGSYYQTADQVRSSTNILYAAPWFGFNGKAFLGICELQAGNAMCYAGSDGSFDAFGAFEAGNATQAVQSAWNSLYTVVAQSNALINNLPGAASSVPAVEVNNALGEARLMRGLAYFYLTRLFGNVPIITDPAPYVGSFSSVRTNLVDDVYKFIKLDLQFAEANCKPGVAGTGHVSSASAAGLLAKVYLYQQQYDSARIQAEKVINSGEFALVGLDAPGAYVNMFERTGNNNKESMIALQWTSNGGYGFGNQHQSVIAPNTDITGTGDGWGQLGPTLDLQNAYAAAGDVVRRHGSIMTAYDFYPQIHSSAGGYYICRIDTTFNGKTYRAVNAQGSGAGMKKYVVGTPADNSGFSAFQATSTNTYLLRFADMYLIAAEAILGKAAGVAPGTGIPLTATSTDGVALGYINKVRQRAGIPPLGSFSYAQLLNERRLEFAIEGDYWYDLQRIDGYQPNVNTGNNPKHGNHPVAISIINNQDRRTVSVDGATGLINGYNPGRSFTLTNAKFLLPYPATEIAAAPALMEDPVPYQF